MNKYIEHIIKDLVRDTKIDYDQDRIYFPFIFPESSPSLSIPIFFHLSNIRLFIYDLSPNNFSIYCKNTFGLTEEEIDYVWDQYKSIIKDKISKRES